MEIVGVGHFGAVLLGASGAMAAPQGVMKQAIHWGLSADWLDPATGSFGVSPAPDCIFSMILW